MQFFRGVTGLRRPVPELAHEPQKRPRASLCPPQRPLQPAAVQQLYLNTLNLLQERYGAMGAKDLTHMLLVVDPAKGATRRPTAGGEALASYIFSVRHEQHRLFGHSKVAWMQKQLPIYSEHPESYKCLSDAIHFYPSLEAAMSYPIMTPPEGLSHATSIALPVRVEGVARTAQSRSDIRGMCMENLATTGAFAAQMEASAAARKDLIHLAAKAKGTRGRSLGPGQVAAGGRLVQAKVSTGVLWHACSDDEVAPQEEEEEHDPFVRADGRGGDHQPAMPARSGYQHAPPVSGRQLLGWKVMATFPTGQAQEVRWHDGIVADFRQLGQSYIYRFFYPIDQGEEWMYGDELPDPGICFRKKNLRDPKCGPQELQAIQKILTKKKGEGEAGANQGASSNSSIRSRADRGMQQQDQQQIQPPSAGKARAAAQHHTWGPQQQSCSSDDECRVVSAPSGVVFNY